MAKPSSTASFNDGALSTQGIAVALLAAIRGEGVAHVTSSKLREKRGCIIIVAFGDMVYSPGKFYFYVAVEEGLVFPQPLGRFSHRRRRLMSTELCHRKTLSDLTLKLFLHFGE